MRKWVHIAVIVCGFAAAVTSTVGVLRSDLLDVRQINIVLDPHSKETFLFQKIKTDLAKKLAHFKGEPVWKVSLREILAEVSKDRRVRSVAVHRDFPNRISLIVGPHDPMLAILDKNGRLRPVAQDSSLLPPVSLKDAPSYPVLRGSRFKNDPSLREKAIALIQSIPKSGSFRRGLVSEISHSKEAGFRLFLTSPRVEIKMGDTDFGPKVDRVNRVLSYLENRNILGRVIDARFSKKVVVRVRNAP